MALVFSDAAAEWPYAEDVTSDFVYLRLHGAEELYASGYDARSLDRWARKLRSWTSGREPRADAKLLYVAPGRVNAAQATILALRSQAHQEFYAVMWLSLQSRRTGAGNAPPPPLLD